MFPFEKVRGIRAGRWLKATLAAALAFVALAVAAAEIAFNTPVLSIKAQQPAQCRVELEWTHEGPTDGYTGYWFQYSVYETVDDKGQSVDADWSGWATLSRGTLVGAHSIRSMGVMATKGNKFKLRVQGGRGISEASNEVTASDLDPTDSRCDRYR